MVFRRRGAGVALAKRTARIAFCRLESIGTPNVKSFAAQWLAYTHPCQRFADGLAAACA